MLDLNSKFWIKFINDYSKDLTYWYIPKGFALKRKTIGILQKRLILLNKYEGKNWGDCQSDYVSQLVKNKLFDRRAKAKQGWADSAAIGRMIKVVMSWLGLAWVDENSNVLLTSTGQKFIRSRNPGEVIGKQLLKLQFYNPTFPKKFFNTIRIFPHIFLLKVLNNMPNLAISRDEFVLFISRAKNDDDLNKVCNQIKLYRNLDEVTQVKLKHKLNKIRISKSDQLSFSEVFAMKGSRRSSIYNTISLDSTYALDFLTFASYMDFDDGIVKINKRYMLDVKRIIRKHDRRSVYIDFQKPKDWFAYYGDYSKDSSYLNALEYYEDIFDVHNAIDIFRKAKNVNLLREGETETDYIEGRISEKMLEDFLEYKLDNLEPGLVLVPHGRQYSTPIGPIDLLAKDKKGRFAIIELKKGRSSDRVVGQLGRYMGWVKGNLLKKPQKVRGFIVGREIDERMIFAIRGLRLTPDVCKVKSYKYFYNFDDVNY